MRKKVRNPRSGYSVGYGRPPTSSQFKPGQSGNPKGRPKGARNASSMARDELEGTISVKEKGKWRKMTVRKAAYRRLAQKAVAGDVKALDYLLSLENAERPPLISLKSKHRPRRIWRSLRTILIVGAPARRITSGMMRLSAEPARLSGEPND
jgi:Family of unknown function (DUF5681)